MNLMFYISFMFVCVCVYAMSRRCQFITVFTLPKFHVLRVIIPPITSQCDVYESSLLGDVTLNLIGQFHMRIRILNLLSS